MTIRLLHITDLHFWNIVYNPVYLCNKRVLGNLNLILRRRKYIHTERSHSFLQLLRTLNPDVLLVGGDLTTTAMPDEFRQAAAFLGKAAELCPAVYLLPGNHDVYTFEAQRHRRFESYFGNYLPVTEDPEASQIPGGLTLVRIPTVRPNLLSSRGGITREQLSRTQELLSEAGQGPTVVLAHYPVLDQTPGYRLGFGRRLACAETLREVLGHAPGPIKYLAGHVHAFSHVVDPLYPNITHITSGALFYGRKGREGGFTELEADGGEVRVFPWTYRDGWVRGDQSFPSA